MDWRSGQFFWGFGSGCATSRFLLKGPVPWPTPPGVVFGSVREILRNHGQFLRKIKSSFRLRDKRETLGSLMKRGQKTIIQCFYFSQIMNNISVDDFHFLTVIGKGTYAKVCLVRRKIDSKLFAMKILKKKYIIKKHQEEHIMTEKQILSEIEHPFLVKLYCSFQDERKLYFVLEYCPGGQLFSLLAMKDRLNEDQAKFFAAEIILALQELHKNKVIYRDLKPENIIIDRRGYIKLTDFGLSKILEEDDEKTKTICGTPEYLAPEIIKNLGHGTDVDWWCLGCLIYEMVTGFPPFRNQNRMKLFQEIVYTNVDVKEFSPKLQDLMKKLLAKETTKRLGHNGPEEIKKHPWFEKINFEVLAHKKMRPPFIPILSSDADTTNFDPEFTNCQVQSYQESPVMETGEIFKEFDFVNK